MRELAHDDPYLRDPHATGFLVEEFVCYPVMLAAPAAPTVDADCDNDPEILEILAA